VVRLPLLLSLPKGNRHSAVTRALQILVLCSYNDAILACEDGIKSAEAGVVRKAPRFPIPLGEQEKLAAFGKCCRSVQLPLAPAG